MPVGKSEKIVKTAIAPEAASKVKKSASQSVQGDTAKARPAKAEKKEGKAGVKKITIKQVIGGGGRKKDQIQTLIGLGLNKLHKVVEVEDTQSTRGMIKKVSHLIKIVNQ